ncbi:hypothetical protein ANCCAN_22915 [Ancylostoma caninum]|uniref:Reverse transcriptase domain-containing protein n=1 Tax=Ancylostoma caninum TaxID=29170 RepID=A0A368FMA1_ANCCA|nr:hypothetical protein ANCCAN_22915 [Ancylostoma caninum]
MVRDLLQGDFMAKIDMKDAYFAVPIHNEHRKFLVFRLGTKLYQFQALPFGLSSAPYVYTRIMRVVATELRRCGIKLIVYLDDWLFMGKNQSSLTQDVKTAITLLGLTINYKKSILVPVQEIEFLDLIINSAKMEWKIPDGKTTVISQQAQKLLQAKTVSLRNVAAFVGRVNSVAVASSLSILYLRRLQAWLAEFHPACLADYEVTGYLSRKCIEDLKWFVNNLKSHTTQPIVESNPSFTFTSDASNSGWGVTTNLGETSGRWNRNESTWHINEKELAACFFFFGLRCFATDLRDCTPKVEIDNTTAVWYINKKGGTRSARLNLLTRMIWLLASERRLGLVACYRPGAQNNEAETLSRHFSDSSDYSLSPVMTSSLFAKWGNPDVVLFASRWNRKCKKFFSLLPDPEASAVNAFAQEWSEIYGYAFPPLNMVGRVIRKAVREKARLILVCPRWESQSWWPLLMRHGEEITELQLTANQLVSPTGFPHPCLERTPFHMIACIIWVSTGEAVV